MGRTYFSSTVASARLSHLIGTAHVTLSLLKSLLHGERLAKLRRIMNGGCLRSSTDIIIKTLHAVYVV